MHSHVLLVVLSAFHQLKESQPQRIGDDFQRIDRRISQSAFDAAEVRLIEAAPLSKLHLAESERIPVRLDGQAYLLGKKSLSHPTTIAFML